MNAQSGLEDVPVRSCRAQVWRAEKQGLGLDLFCLSTSLDQGSALREGQGMCLVIQVDLG